MRIGLKVGSTYHWLAGEPAVSVRAHSWADRFALTPESAQQVAQFVRGTHAKPIDRGNLLQNVSFSTTRQFASPAEAMLWCLDYDGAFPRSGELIFEAIAPNGTVTRRSMANAVVSPPARRINGASAFVDYQVRGGAVTVPPLAASGTVTYVGAGSGTLTIGSRVYNFIGIGPRANATDLLFQFGGVEPNAEELVTAVNTGHGFDAGDPLVTASRVGAVVTLTAKTVGAAGNSIALATTNTEITLSGSTLTGGTD
jgi:hypothetical protein